MDTLLNRRCLEVLHADSVGGFSKLIVDFTGGLGFSTFGAMVVTDHSSTMTEFQTITNAPVGHREEFDDFEQGRNDPVNQHCKLQSSPIVWSRQTYKSSGQQALWARQAEFGYRSGVAFAMHLGHGRHYMFGANWEHDRCEAVANFRAIAEDLLVFGTYSQAAAFDLCCRSRPDPSNAYSFAKSELEALRWAMDGLTNWEIGRKMALSACDVTLRLHRVMKRLGCGSKYEAVLKGIKLGLIEAD
jgi:DNA-binding CsgD family transcriptional regulator